jgi:hypothetical protein
MMQPAMSRAAAIGQPRRSTSVALATIGDSPRV